MNRTRRLLIIAIVAIAGVVGWLRFVTHDTPAGQRPLTHLDSAALETLKAEFNGASGETRIIALLSPT